MLGTVAAIGFLVIVLCGVVLALLKDPVDDLPPRPDPDGKHAEEVRKLLGGSNQHDGREL